MISQASGPYVFRPEGTEPKETKMTGVEKGEFVKNKFKEYRLMFNVNWAEIYVRKFDDKDELEIEWHVGPIDGD